MVNGIDIFREHFNHFKEQYTVIFESKIASFYRSLCLSSLAFPKAPIGLKACCRIEFLRRLIECPDIQCHLIKISMFCLRFANVSKRIESTR